MSEGTDKPICYDLCCGLGGWTEAFLAEGYRCIGFDIEAHDYGTGGYPGELRLRDILTLHGSELKDATVIVGSSPCQKYSYMAMPWKRAKAMVAYYEDKSHPGRLEELNALFNAQFRIQREASEAAGHYIPLIVENVRGAQKWVGRAQANYGSFYLWGDVGIVSNRVVAVVEGKILGGRGISPMKAHKVPGFRFDGSGKSFQTASVEMGRKGPGGDWFQDGRQGQDACVEAIKNNGGSWFAIGSPGQKVTGQNPDGRKVPGIKLSEVGFNVAAAQRYREGVKLKDQDGYERDHPQAFGWKAPRTSSRSNSRKAASAMIAKIPFPLAAHIAKSFKPRERELKG